MNSGLIDLSKRAFNDEIITFGQDPYNLSSHVSEMEKWANYMCNKNKDADREVVLLSVWLHDIGHYPIPTNIDHAVRSEERAKTILTNNNYDKNKMKEVLHCIRAHRCRDVLPKTLEAKIIAFCDSASHITDDMYFKIAKDYKTGLTDTNVFDKMERDLRDLDSFKEEKDKVLKMVDAWKNLINEYNNIDFL